MLNLEEQADNANARELYWKPMGWLGAIRPTTANDAFDPALWETFVSTTLGLEVPTLAAPVINTHTVFKIPPPRARHAVRHGALPPPARHAARHCAVRVTARPTRHGALDAPAAGCGVGNIGGGAL